MSKTSTTTICISGLMTIQGKPLFKALGQAQRAMPMGADVRRDIGKAMGALQFLGLHAECIGVPHLEQREALLADCLEAMRAELGTERVQMQFALRQPLADACAALSNLLEHLRMGLY